MTAAAFIPARAHSTRLPNKNTRTVAGVPLVVRAVQVAKQAQAIGLVGEVWVDVEDGVTEKLALGAGATVRWRHYDLRTPETRVVDLVRHWLGGGEDAFGRVLDPMPDLVCVLLPTSPLRTLRHLVESRLLLDDAAEGVMSVTPYRQDTAYALREDAGFLRLRFDPKEVRPSFQHDGVHDGTCLWARSSALLGLPPEANFYGLRLRPYRVPPEESVDVNTERDLVVAEALIDSKGTR